MNCGRSLCIHTWTNCATVACVVCCGVVLSLSVKLKSMRNSEHASALLVDSSSEYKNWFYRFARREINCVL